MTCIMHHTNFMYKAASHDLLWLTCHNFELLMIFEIHTVSCVYVINRMAAFLLFFTQLSQGTYSTNQLFINIA